MFRKLASFAVFGLFLCASAVLASEIKGKVAKVDESNKTITLTTSGKDVEYAIAKDCKWPKTKNKSGEEKEMDLKSLAKMAERGKKDGKSFEITAVVEKKDGKEVVTEIKLEGRGKKKKDDK